jgi:hypothetical protein
VISTTGKKNVLVFTLWASLSDSDSVLRVTMKQGDPKGRLRHQLRPNKTGKPMILHLLRYQGIAVAYYSFTFGRLEATASSTFVTSG